MSEPRYPLLAVNRLRMAVDGAGVTTLIAGAGCPLSCKWCINRQLLHEKAPTLVTAQQLVEQVKCDNLYFLATGGGVTFGGGEPLLHAAFLAAFRKACPAGWKINVETSLQVPQEQVELAAQAADFFIVDIKDLDAEIYRRYTGGDNARVLSNLNWLIGAVGQERICVRVPLIPAYNTPENQEKTVSYLKSVGICRLDCFAYIQK